MLPPVREGALASCLSESLSAFTSAPFVCLFTAPPWSTSDAGALTSRGLAPVLPPAVCWLPPTNSPPAAESEDSARFLDLPLPASPTLPGKAPRERLTPLSPSSSAPEPAPDAASPSPPIALLVTLPPSFEEPETPPPLTISHNALHAKRLALFFPREPRSGRRRALHTILPLLEKILCAPWEKIFSRPGQWDGPGHTIRIKQGLLGLL
jgi:hypothetical protein